MIQAEPGQLIVENFTVGLAEVAVRNTPIGNRPGNAMDELAHRGFTFRHVLLAVKILRDNDLHCQQRPRLRRFDIFLLEDDFTGVVGDFGGAAVPFNLIERLDLRIAENAPDGQRLFHCVRLALEPVGAPRNHRHGTMAFVRRRSQNFFARVNHEFPFRGG